MILAAAPNEKVLSEIKVSDSQLAAEGNKACSL